MRSSYLAFHFSFRFTSIFWFIVAFLLSVIPATAMADDAVTPQAIQWHITHADHAKTLQVLAQTQKADPHSANVQTSHQKPKIFHGSLWLLMEILFMAIGILVAFVIFVVFVWA